MHRKEIEESKVGNISSQKFIVLYLKYHSDYTSHNIPFTTLDYRKIDEYKYIAIDPAIEQYHAITLINNY